MHDPLDQLNCPCAACMKSDFIVLSSNRPFGVLSSYCSLLGLSHERHIWETCVRTQWSSLISS
jgi:hypothetical protein